MSGPTLSAAGSEGDVFEIAGGAGRLEAAAVLAVAALVLAEEEAVLAAPPRRFTTGAWVLSTRPRAGVGPGQRVSGPMDWVLETQEEEEL